VAKPTKRPTKHKIETGTGKVMPTGKPREAVKRVSKDDDVTTDVDPELDDTVAGTKARAAKSADKDSGAKSGKVSRAEAKAAAKDANASRRTNKRVTPKGGPAPSGRYTPPTARYEDLPSPMWVPILMFTLFGLGMLSIFLNYVGLLPGATSNWYLLLGLGFILAGIITATQYR
jgi:hypothetical protein